MRGNLIRCLISTLSWPGANPSPIEMDMRQSVFVEGLARVLWTPAFEEKTDDRLTKIVNELKKNVLAYRRGLQEERVLRYKRIVILGLDLCELIAPAERPCFGLIAGI